MQFWQLLVPLRADDGLLDLVVAAVDLAGLAEHAHAVGILELDGEVVEDVAVLLAGADLAPADGRRRRGSDARRAPSS